MAPVAPCHSGGHTRARARVAGVRTTAQGLVEENTFLKKTPERTQVVSCDRALGPVRKGRWLQLGLCRRPWGDPLFQVMSLSFPLREVQSANLMKEMIHGEHFCALGEDSVLLTGEVTYLQTLPEKKGSAHKQQETF